jgi:hypothetical protein
MTTENINLVLANAQCCISKYAVKVSKLLSINDNCAESEVVKLKLMNDYFEVACEYKNDVVIVSSEDSEIVLTTPTDSILYLNDTLEMGDNFQIFVNGVLYTILGNKFITIGELIINKLKDLGIYISHKVIYETVDSGVISMSYAIKLPCDISSMRVVYRLDYIDGILKTPGVCDIKTMMNYDNCITPEEFEIVINKLMKVCEICPCQLT